MKWQINVKNLDYRTSRFGAPGWVLWVAVAVGLLVLIIPMAAMLILAGLVSGILFLVLGVIARIGQWLNQGLGILRSLFTGLDRDGRRNVRVVPRSATRNGK